MLHDLKWVVIVSFVDNVELLIPKYRNYKTMVIVIQLQVRNHYNSIIMLSVVLLSSFISLSWQIKNSVVFEDVC